MPLNTTAHEFWFVRMNRRERVRVRTATSITVSDKFEPDDFEELKEFILTIHPGVDLETLRDATEGPQKRVYRLMVELFGRNRANELTSAP